MPMWDEDPVTGLIGMLGRARVAGDLDAVMAYFAEDTRFHVLGLAEPAIGKDAVRAALRHLIDLYEFVDVRPIQSVVQGDTIALRYHLTVRHVPSGRTSDSEVADFVTLRDGHCVSYTQYIDTAQVQAMTRG